MAEDADGNIKGFLVAQLAVHVEPWWVATSERGTMAAWQLWDHMMNFLREKEIKVFFSHASSPEAAEYAKRLGLKELDMTPFVGEL